ncbi:MAG: PhnD/SsuA/transferrin family substrate-binding protein [Anaerolineae bacterium]|nr:PhnD/SsuA/transferrin family substrate-binding protein [Anaerolineae bacterium]
MMLLASMACVATPLARPSVTPAPVSRERPEYPIPPGLINTITPGPTPTIYPLGSSDNPIVLAFVTENPDDVSLAAIGEIARFVTDSTGYYFEPAVFASYNDLLPELQAGLVHFAWLPPITYLWAHQNNYANATLLTNHFGITKYGTQFLANSDSGFTIYFDPENSTNSADDATALAQFAGYRPCWVDPSSISGYILPAGLLAENQVEVSSGVMAQDHTAVIRSLYVKGVCDFGVTYTYSGDPRTANSLTDLTDVSTQIPIIWRSDAVIPTLNLSSHPRVHPEIILALSSTLTQLGSQPDGQALLSTANDYEIAGLDAAKDEMYDDLRLAVDALGLDIEPLIGY